MSPRNQERKQAKRQGPSLLDEVLERRVLLYLVAAGATLAGASAAQAKVVYTPSNAVVSLFGPRLEIDLNNDGTADFQLAASFGYSSSGRGGCPSGVRQMTVSGVGLKGHNTPSNGIVGSDLGQPLGLATALKRGAPIGGNAKFYNLSQGGHFGQVLEYFVGASCRGSGNFQNVTNRYLGVRFIIDNQVHYGWIGFRTVTLGGSNGRDDLAAKLAGWAYETEPNKSIVAGAMGEQDAESNSAALRSAEPTSLELLAAGHVAVADWRRRLKEDLPASTPLLN
jgi:hypothetical protein